MTGAVLRPTLMSVSKSALADNVRLLKSRLDGKARMLAVVKADAYGHGSVEEAKIAIKNGADAVAIAVVDEALALREAGIKSPMLVLGATLTPEAIEAAVAGNVTLAVFDSNTIRLMQRFAEKYDTVAHAHLKIDTGMSRIGLRSMDALEKVLETIRSCPRVKCEGVFTHFAVADSDTEFTFDQDKEFMQYVKRVRDEGYKVLAHASASSAMLADSRLWHDMVRPGIALYGAAVRDIMPQLRPCQRLTTKAVRIEKIYAGDSVSYGRTFVSQGDSVIATLPIGYGDGYPRILSNKAQVLVKGQRANITGRVCMDMFMIDVTHIPGISLDDEIVMMGSQGADAITPDELAEKAQTIPYEIMLGFKDRIPRVYTD